MRHKAEVKSNAMVLDLAGHSPFEIGEKLKVHPNTVRQWLRLWREDPDVSGFIKSESLLIAERAGALMHDIIDILEDIDVSTEEGRKTLLKHAKLIGSYRNMAVDKIIGQARNDTGDANTEVLRGLLAQMAPKEMPQEFPALPAQITEVPNDK